MSLWTFIIIGAALSSIITEGVKVIWDPKSKKLKPFLYALIAIVPSIGAGIVLSKLFPMDTESQLSVWIAYGATVYVIQYIAGITITKKLGEVIQEKLKSL